MRNFKRFLTLALAMVMLVSAFAMGTSAAKFTDVDEENEYLAKAVNLLSYVGVTKGTTETTFGTEELVTREQMAAFIYRLMKKGNSVEGGSNTSAFTDLEDPTFFFMVSWANNQGIIKGTSATTFEPKGSITLQDAYTMIVRALGYENEETLAYPYGYIDVAEAKGVELGEGLDSSVSYTDALTRGDVAVLLYNAFFAETGVAETKQVEKKIGGDDDNATWVLETVTHYPTFCEKYFDVIEVEYQAVATPMYTFGKDVKETTATFGYDVIDFREIKTNGDTDAPDQAYIAFEDLGLEGDVNDYIMSHFTMYVILDDDEIEEVLYAEPLMTVKNVNELKFATVSTNTKGSYIDADYTVKALNGKVEFDGEVAYFYDAPYSYATPKYTAVPKDKDGNPIKSADEHKYDERNAENLEIIELKPLNVFDVEEPEYTLAVKPVAFEKFADIDADDYVAASKNLIDTFKEAYVGGLFEADVYDVNGDGLYDYINYMPYKAYFVDADEDKTFFDNKYTTDGKKNVVYTEGAFLAGEEFEDEDFIIGYFDEAINYINVAAVVEPVNGSVTKFKAPTGMITINGEQEVSVKDAWRVVANAEQKYAEGDGSVAQNLVNVGYNVEKVQWNAFDAELLVAGVYDKEDVDFYVYEDVLLFQEGIDGANTFDGQLIVVTKDEKGNFIKGGNFNPVTGGETTYVHVWMDGEVKWVPFNTKSKVTPKLEETASPDTVNLYLDKLATYSEADGLYTIKPVANGSVKVDGEDLTLPAFDKAKFADEELADYQAYKAYANAYLVKRSGQRFVLSSVPTFDNTKRVEKDVEFILNDNTVILVKNTYKDADLETVIDYLEFDASEIKETVASELKNIQVILGNNVDYKNREDVLVLYAEFDSNDYYASADDYGDLFKLTKAKKSTKSERIVKMTGVDVNEDGKFYATYDVFNPYTGATVPVVGTTTSTSDSYVSPYKVGDVVEVNSNDEIEDASRAADTKSIVSKDNSAYYFVTGYSAAENTVELVKVPAGVTADTFDAAIDEASYITLDVSEAAVAVIAQQTRALNEDMVRWGSLTVGDVDKLDGSDKSYLALNNNYEPKPGAALKTVYAKYVKVYVDYDANSAADIEETGIDGEANFIIVVANNGENLAYCDLD